MDDDAISADLFSLEQSADDDQHAPHVLANVVLRKAKELDDAGHGTRVRLEKSVKMVLVVTSVATLVALFFAI